MQEISSWRIPEQLISNPPHHYFRTPPPNTSLLSPSTFYLPPLPHSSFPVFPPTLSHYPSIPIPREEGTTVQYVPTLCNVNLPVRPCAPSEGPSVPVNAQMQVEEFSLSSPPPLEHDPPLDDFLSLLLPPTSVSAGLNLDSAPLRSLTPPPEQVSPQAVPGSKCPSLPHPSSEHSSLSPTSTSSVVPNVRLNPAGQNQAPMPVSTCAYSAMSMT